MKKFIFKSVSILSFLLLFGCQDILECVINRHPELPNKTLSDGHVGEYYYEIIRASINNEPMDNSYDYYFSIADNLPEGLHITIHYRDIIIEGYPQDSGEFFLDVQLWVEQYRGYYDDCYNTLNDCDGLCDEDTSRTYYIDIF